MLFVTNRRLRQRPSRTPAGGRIPNPRRVDFRLDDAEPSAAVHFCERLGAGRCREVFSTGLLEALRVSAARHVLLYIHGFNNLPERDVFERAGTLQSLCDATAEPGLVQVVPMLWPCDNDRGLLKGYWDDRNAADAGAVGFRRAFGKFPSWRDRQDPDNPCLKRIHVLAHSMGARVLFTHQCTP